MKVLLYNRALLFLGFVGMFVAAVLSYGKYANIVPPCGMGGGCARVESDASSVLFSIGDFHLAVAYVGLLGYLILTALAFMRSFAPPGRFRMLTVIGYIVAVFGTIVSIAYQGYALIVLQATCKWCLSSAITMTLTVVLYAFMFQVLTDSTDAELARGKGMAVPDQATSPEVADGHPITQAATQNVITDYLIASGFSIACIVAVACVGWQMAHDPQEAGKPIKIPQNLTLVPSDANYFGNPTASVKIVEFADLNCPSCQKHSPLVKEFVRQHFDHVELVYRNFPLPVHKTSELAAAIDEYAAEKGKFWDYVMAVMATKSEDNSPDTLFTIAGQVNLDVNDLKRRLQNDSDPLYKRLTQDLNAGNAIGVSATPTFVLLAPGQPARAYGGGSLLDALKNAPYAKYVNGTA